MEEHVWLPPGDIIVTINETSNPMNISSESQREKESRGRNKVRQHNEKGSIPEIV
jgi:hypothetical protein